jgi:hypothetical protein
MLEFGLLALVFVHLLILLPFKLWSAHRANRRMDEFFQQHAMGWGVIQPGESAGGFVFTSLDEGTKKFAVKFFGTAGNKEFAFSIPVRGLRADHHSRQLTEAETEGEINACDHEALRNRLAAMPRCTVNRAGTREGDPLNLVVIGRFETVLNGFGARADADGLLAGPALPLLARERAVLSGP